MGDQKVYAGIDVAKERLEVAVRPSGEFFAEVNDKRAVSRLVKRLTRWTAYAWWWKPPVVMKP